MSTVFATNSANLNYSQMLVKFCSIFRRNVVSTLGVLIFRVNTVFTRQQQESQAKYLYVDKLLNNFYSNVPVSGTQTIENNTIIKKIVRQDYKK